MNIYLLRHGETDWNRQGCIQGHTDILLNENGKKQIALTAAGLADVCPNMDVILCSPLSRAKESAEIAAEQLHYPKDNIVEEPLLIERCFGEAEGMTAAEREQKYPNYHYSDIGYVFPGMEPYEELIERADGVFHKITDTYKDKGNILAVSHGAMLAAVITAVTDGRIAYFSGAISLDSGSLFRVRYTDQVIELAGYSVKESAFTVIDL